jgi:hypothetical protein
MSTEVATAPARPRPKLEAIALPHLELDWFEIAVGGLFAAVSMWVLALDLYQVIVHHRTWTGTDGLFLADQMQYLAWIRDAAHHGGLVSNMFVLRPTPHDYFQPVIAISAIFNALGVPAWLSLLLWKPFAVAAAFLGSRAYVRYALPDRFDRRAALVLALFFGSWGVIGDEWMPFWSWGYPFGLLAIAAVAGAIISYDRARRQGRLTWIAPVLGVVASFTHPWQGELLILIVIGAELVTWERGQRLRDRFMLPAITVIATALPLLYYEALYRLDINWHHAQEASKHVYSLWGILMPLLPLMIVGALAYRRRPRTFFEAATRVWLFAALAIFGLSQTGLSGTPLHAFAGITIPLAVLAVEGVQSIGFRRIPGWRLIAIALVAAATIPASVFELRTTSNYQRPNPYDANFIAKGESNALNYLAKDPQPGGVLARSTFGLIVPAETGRHTYVGSILWSQPNGDERLVDTRNLFLGQDSRTVARAFVRLTGARFLIKDCNSPDVLQRELGSMIVSAKHFGCAAVYQVRVSS